MRRADLPWVVALAVACGVGVAIYLAIEGGEPGAAPGSDAGPQAAVDAAADGRMADASGSAPARAGGRDRPSDLEAAAARGLSAEVVDRLSAREEIDDTVHDRDRTRQQYTGWIRFVHLAEGTGPLRVVADNWPGFDESHVEVLLAEGESSGYIEAPSVKHRVALYPASTRGGEPEPFVADFEADVYHRAGCTVVIHGSRRRPGRAADHLALARLVDVPATTDPGTTPVRFYPAVVGLDRLTVSVADDRVVDDVPFGEATGYRILAAGVVRLQPMIRGRPLGRPIEISLPAEQAHTVYLHGTRRSVIALLQPDNPLAEGSR